MSRGDRTEQLVRGLMQWWWSCLHDKFLFFPPFFGGHLPILCCHWYPCFGLLVTTDRGFRVRLNPLTCVLCCLCKMNSSISPLSVIPADFDHRHGSQSPLPTYVTARQRSCGNVMFSVIWPLQTYSNLFTCKSPTHIGTPFPPPQLQSRPPPAPALVLFLAPSPDMFKLVHFGRWAVGFD